MSKIYMLDLGFLEDSILYELEPKEVDRVNGTLQDVKVMLEKNKAKFIVIDSASPDAIDHLRKIPGDKEGSGLFKRTGPKYYLITGRVPVVKERHE